MSRKVMPYLRCLVMKEEENRVQKIGLNGSQIVYRIQKKTDRRARTHDQFIKSTAPLRKQQQRALFSAGFSWKHVMMS
jgi:hypothetical protein